MKEFDLNAALNGEPVMLRGGCKAIIYYKVPDEYKFADNKPVFYPLKGLTFDVNGNLAVSAMYWHASGKFDSKKDHSLDIIGMWEEPKLTTEEIMEKAFQENLVLVHNVLSPFCGGFNVVGKTLDNKYILQDLDDGSLQFLHVFNKKLEWSVKE